MSVLDEILGAVEGIVGDYNSWKVGVSRTPRDKDKDFQAATGWHQWDARSEVAARAVSQYLTDRGMKNHESADMLPTYVYIFKD